MSCQYAKLNDEDRYNCKITDDECVFLIPNKKRCQEEGYIDEDD